MGSGFALYCLPGTGAEIVDLASELGFTALVAGRVERGPRQVVIEPAGVRFEDAELELSAG
jgi:phosphoribosylformylglycinamidine cyclo-ligase